MSKYVWIASAALLGCAVQLPQEPQSGALSLGLRQTTQDGASYRLASAQLAIAGAEARTLTPSADDETLAVELVPGDYTLQLLDGFVLEQAQGDTWVPVTATLASDNPQPFSIVATEVTTVALRFEVADATMVELVSGSLRVELQVERQMELPTEQAGAGGGAGGGAGSGACVQRLVINELDYDQDGADTLDFAELYNAGACAVDTAGLSLSLVNGGVTPAASYERVDLSLAGPSIAPGAFVVVGSPALVALVPDAVQRIGVQGFAIQNGSPDGLRVERDGSVLDAVSYGGVMAGLTELASAPADRGAGSIGRCGDGHDTDDNGADFTQHATPTPGTANACP